METVYDWATVSIFAGLVVLFLERSTKDEPTDSLYQYLIPATGSAVANYLGNESYDIAAIALIGAIVAYVVWVLKPFDFDRSDKT